MVRHSFTSSNSHSHYLCRYPPSQGPLSAPLPGPGGMLPGAMPPGMGMGPPPPGPGPDEPPPPARPAWRNIQQRVPRRRRTGRTETTAMPEATLAPEPPAPHPASWHRWERKLTYSYYGWPLMLIFDDSEPGFRAHTSSAWGQHARGPSFEQHWSFWPSIAF